MEQKLQSCTLELTIATNSVSEARNRERVSMRRLSAGVEREKQERKKLSNKYSKDTIGMKRDIDQLMVELQAERAERSKDVKGNCAVLGLCTVLLTFVFLRLGNCCGGFNE